MNNASVDNQKKAVEKVIRIGSSAAAATILIPLSVLDVVLVIPVQQRMVRDIARIHRCRDGEKAPRRVFRALRWKLVRKYAAIVGAKMISSTPFIPFVGNLVGMAVAYALTRALGELSDQYFAGACTMSGGRMAECFDLIYKEQYELAYERRRNELRAMWQTPAVRRQVRELRKASLRGQLSEDEARRRTEELLGLR